MLRDLLRELLSNCRGPPIALFLALSLLMTNPAPAIADGPSPSDTDDLHEFIEDTMNDHFDSYDLAGAVISIVQGDEIVYSGGHGYADLDQQVAADPGETLFRVGSVTKLFTWTAAMQLVEEGRLDLDEDVNAYLSEPLEPDAYEEPVTMAGLMSHTSGFDERVVGVFARSADELRPLSETLDDQLPPRVRAPGEYSAYSNYGVGLAGRVIEEITGASWEEYVEENILEPLNMEQTTPRQPVPNDTGAAVATGYEDALGDLEERDFEYVGVPPAGAISSTAEDMANFMIAHLQEGRFEDSRILSEDTAALMHSQHFSHHPEVGGWAHGFMERYYNEQRFIGHDGATLVFVSNLWLDPEENVGIFLSYNTRDGGGESGLEFIQEFADRYYPSDDLSERESSSGASGRIDNISGSYRPVQLPESNVDKVMGLVGVLSVSQERESTIKVDPMGESPLYFEEVAPYEFRPVDDDQTMGTLVFQKDENGDGYDLFVQNMPETAFEPVPWHEGLFFNLTVLGASMLLFLSAVIAWPIAAWRNRDQEAEPDLTARIGGPLGWLVSLLYVLFVVSLAAAFSGDPMQLAFGVPTLAVVGLAFGMAAAILAVPTLALAVFAWLRGHWGTLGRAHFTMVAVSAIAMLWWLIHWNLLGFQY